MSEDPRGVVFEHRGAAFASGFYACHFNVTSTATSYIFIDVQHISIPLTGTARVAVGTGRQGHGTDTVVLVPGVPLVPARTVGTLFIVGPSRQVWISIHSAVLRTTWRKIEVDLNIYQREQSEYRPIHKI